MAPNLKSGEDITTISIKRKTLAVFQILRLLSGKDTLQFFEDLGEALDPVVDNYVPLLKEGKKVNIDIKRIGNIVQIGIAPKLGIGTKKCKPIVARYSRKGKFKGVVK
jgi:hypothetical protein